MSRPQLESKKKVDLTNQKINSYLSCSYCNNSYFSLRTSRVFKKKKSSSLLPNFSSQSFTKPHHFHPLTQQSLSHTYDTGGVCFTFLPSVRALTCPIFPHHERYRGMEPQSHGVEACLTERTNRTICHSHFLRVSNAGPRT